MLNRILKRLLIMIPTLIGITLISFALIRLAPGDPAVIRAQEAAGKVDARSAAILLERSRREFGLNEPIVVQYAKWLGRIVRFDFGTSYRSGRPVGELISKALPVTVALNVFAFAIIYMLAMPIGAYSAMKPGGILDKLSASIFIFLYSLPSFWVAVVLLIIFGGADYLNILPIAGFASPNVGELAWYDQILNVVWHLVLPAFCLAYAGWAFLSRLSRSTFLEVMKSDYIRTAYAKGCGDFRVLWRHALRNAAVPFVTILGGLIPAMISGSIIIEKIFSLQGMGMLMFDAVLARDYPLIMGATTLGAILVLFGLLVSDVLYVIVDPRLKESR